MGSSWLNQPTVRMLESLGIRYDTSLLHGVGPRLMSDTVGPGEATGTLPDCSTLPGHPFRPSLEDFTIPDPTRRQGVWLMPVCTGFFRFPWWRRLYRRWRGYKQDGSKLKKLSLGLGPSLFGPGFNHWLEASERRPVLITMRSSQFVAALPQMQDSILFLASHPGAGRFAFSTPAEALKLLGLEAEGGSGS